MPLVAASQAELESVIQTTGAALLVVPVYGALDESVRCVRSLVEHSPTATQILVIDDGSNDPRLPDLLKDLQTPGSGIFVWRRSENIGFVRTMNQAFEIAGRRDVILINSDVVVGPGWLERLTAAAYSNYRIATATPLTNNGTILSVPNGSPTSSLPDGHTVCSAAIAVANASRRRYPRIPVCVGHLVYIKRSALDLAGFFDEEFTPGYSEEVDFSLRCAGLGLLHVCADDVFVYHTGGASFKRDPRCDEYRRKGHEIIRNRYPFYYAWVGSVDVGDDSPLAAAKGSARIALRGLHILIDATCLGPKLRNGTQRGTLEVLIALAQHPAVSRVTALLADAISAEQVLDLLPAGVAIDFVKVQDLNQDRAPADVAFRPFQIHGSVDELRALKSAARRTIVWQLDFFSYENPFYHGSDERWNEVRDLTNLTLGTVDGIALNSRDVLEAGRTNGLLTPGKTARVIYPGTDHLSTGTVARRPSGHRDHRRFVLCLGTDYAHKNHPFAIRVFSAMRSMGYEGILVFAGAGVPHGSSRLLEEELIGSSSIHDDVVYLANVSDPEREWLYRNSDLILYPSVAEGFGLIPFEAAAAGIPCLSSRNGSLNEILPEDIETIESWEPRRCALTALKLIHDPAARRRQVELIVARSHEFSWRRCADQIVDFVYEVFGEVPNRVQSITSEKGAMLAIGKQGVLSSSLELLDAVSKRLIAPPSGVRPLVWMARKVLSRPYRALVRFSAGRVSTS